MKRNTKTVWKHFDYLHCDDFADYLGKMSRQGWHFKEWKAGLVFERGEPEEAAYAVEVFIDGSEYTTRPEVETEEFAEYCEAAGWHLVDAKRKFCIFKKVRSDADEILTDQERLCNIAKEEQKSVLRDLGTSVMWCILQTIQFTGSGFVNRIFANEFLLILLLWYSMAVAAIGRGIHFLLWKHRSQKQIAEGQNLRFGKVKNGFSFTNGWYSRVSMTAITLYALGLVLLGDFRALLLILGILVPIIIMCYLIARFRPDAVTNQIIQTLVPCFALLLVLIVTFGVIFDSDDTQVDMADVPLRYEDIGGDLGELEKVTLDKSDSVFGSALRCWLYYEEQYIYYQVYQSDYEWVLDTIWKNRMDKKYNQLGQNVTVLFDAQEAVRNTLGDYLVRYPDAILLLNMEDGVELTSEQAQSIRTALLESR